MPNKKLPNIDPEFIVICASVWCNEAGVGVSYDWDGQRFNNRSAAIKHGWKLRGSDDFNIGQTYGDNLIWFGWMDKRIDNDESVVREIAGAIDLSFDPRWYALEFSKATGRVIGLRNQERTDEAARRDRRRLQRSRQRIIRWQDDNDLLRRDGD